MVCKFVQIQYGFCLYFYRSYFFNRLVVLILKGDFLMKNSNNRMSKFTFLRITLGGAIAGIALTGIVTSFLGVDLSDVKDIIGGTLGVGIVALLKFAHVI